MSKKGFIASVKEKKIYAEPSGKTKKGNDGVERKLYNLYKIR